ncbi:MAG: hypothetical protein ACRD0L_17300 [Acidimicrobiales bacterium]
MAETTTPASTARREPRHFLRILIAWGISAAVVTPIMYYVLGPHLAPGRQTNVAASQQWDMTVLLTIGAPVMMMVYVWIGYALIFFRQKGSTIEDGVWLKKDSVPIQIAWVLASSTVVMFLFIFGTYELINPAGAGGGEGPSAIWTPAGVHQAKVWKPAANPAQLQVQVIGQQWQWTFRWPQFGGVETSGLELPVNTSIQFNVTSLDVIHSFWAYRLGVKADANPGVNNIAFAEATQTGRFTVRCDELCGIWHGAMVNTASVVSQQAFYTWLKGEETALAAVTKELPPYSLTYTPSLVGAGGGYYANNASPSPPPAKS